ncbi:MAG: Tyrosine recombinase XerC [Syntrophomonadaceae bacterium]|nr:Tyrosine recombinase XerC [Bacillota bacterium]MBT9147171.1 Tyrosine recombinase XerC [Bacillota bacterium]
MLNNGALALKEQDTGRYGEILSYLSEDDGYWIENDVWEVQNKAFTDNGLFPYLRKAATKIDFSHYAEETIRNEVKYYLLSSLKKGDLKLGNVLNIYSMPIKRLGEYVNALDIRGIKELKEDERLIMYLNQHYAKRKGCCKNWTHYLSFKNGITEFIHDFYDEREEMEKDVWYAAKLPGVRISACDRRGRGSISFADIPGYYRPMAKRYLGKLITRRSWSYCGETLVYLKYFFGTFYRHGHGDGFLENLRREDVEKYLIWIMEDHKDSNDTYRSKAVSFVRYFLDYIQMAEFPLAPTKDIDRLIFDDDIPRRERISDTMEKVKYIPEPVREKLDATIMDIEPKEMMTVYVLLRETGWRGTDVLNLRYDNCLDYLWNKVENRYVPYLCGEITKTGILRLKIPIRDEVEKMVRKLAGEAKEKSTDDSNPEKYLFNTYDGRNMGMPISKPAFVQAVRELIEIKGITDASGELYHFKTHALRHTRAVEYVEQGMPIGVIQQILGHCSLQMTLHYAKVSENALYEKWKATERLNLFHVEGAEPPKVSSERAQVESIRYEFVRKTLDAVRVPFGTCFKPSKIACKHQMEKCLECPNFCSVEDNIPEYEAEIKRVEELIRLCQCISRKDWEEKNTEYLELLKKMLERIRKERIVHKNGQFREGM